MMIQFPGCRPLLAAPLLLCLALGCGGEAGEGGTPPPDACSLLRLEAGEAKPLDEIEVHGLPDHFGELLAARVTTDAGSTSLTLVARSEESPAIFLHAPIHPEGRLEGGDVSLVIEDEAGRACPPQPFRILPLDPAPGATRQVLDTTRAILEKQSVYFGTTLAELRATPVENLAPELLPLYLAQDALDNPDNPNSLLALLDGTAPALEGEPAGLELVDALLAHVGLPAAQEESLAVLPDNAPIALQKRAMRALSSTGSGPENAYQLHAEMEMAQWGRTYTEPNPLSDTINQAVTGVGLVGLIPHPLAKGGAVLVGTTLFSVLKVAEAAAKLLPSRFVWIDFELRPERFVEDDPSVGVWSDAKVVAASTGWKLDQAILESLLQTVKVKGGFSAWMGRFGPAATTSLRQKLQVPATAQAIKHLANDSGFIEILPEETSPIDVTDEEWSFATVHFALVEESRQRFRLDPSWPGELRGEIKVGTALGKFGGRHMYLEKEVVVDPVRIRIDPDSVSVEPGETVNFMVTVDATNPAISIEVGNGTFTHQDRGDGTHLIIYVAPADESGLPDRLQITSESHQGMLSNPARPRPQAAAIIRSRKPSIEVSPDGVCVKSGEKETFVATVHNLDNDAVRWDASIGTITSAGVFTAPDEGGAATITATSVEVPGLSSSVTVGVGSCTCHWHVDVSGGPPTRFGGSTFTLGVRDGEVFALLFASPYDGVLGAIAGGVQAELQDPLPFETTGHSSASLGGGFFSAGPTQDADTFGSIDPVSADIRLFEKIGTRYRVEGVIRGQIFWERIADEGPEEETDWPGYLHLSFDGIVETSAAGLYCNPF